MKTQYLIKCDEEYIQYDKYKNMHHKFKKVNSRALATTFLMYSECINCLRDLVEFYDFKEAEIIEFKSILTIKKPIL